MNLEQAIQQAEKMASGGYSPDELRDFLSFMDGAASEEVSRVLEVYQAAFDGLASYRLEVGQDLMSRLKTLRPVEVQPVGDEVQPRVVLIRRMRWAAAAVVILLATGVYLWTLSRRGAEQQPILNEPTLAGNDVRPGGNKAILTLAGGRQIILDSAQTGDLTTQGNVKVSKADNGKIVYHPMGDPLGETTMYNTLTTPRGGEYQLKLPDGTQVWLNAASSITYPTAFTGKERRVKVTGEAYFEVASDARRPFLVEEHDLVVKVLGTRFDVNGYDNEPIRKTVLVDGAVNVSYLGLDRRLASGQQAQVEQGTLTVTPANIEQTLAWKNGFFAFVNADLPAVMRQMARWYDVDVHYEGIIPKDAFSFNGKIGRSLTLDQVLKLLTQARVHYTIQGNQLTIRP